MQGWGGSCRGGVDHEGIGWVMHGWCGSCRGGGGHTGVVVGDARVGWVCHAEVG